MEILNINLWSLLAGAIAFLTLLIFVPKLVRAYLGEVPWWFERQAQRAWDEAGERLQLQRLPGLRLKGVRHDRSLDLRTEKVRSPTGAEEQKFSTTVEVNLHHPIWKTLKIRPRGVVGKLERLATGSMMEQYGSERSHATGDWEFDNEFFVGGQLDAAAREALRRSRLQKALRQACRGQSSFEIRLGVIYFHLDRGIAQEDELVRLVNRCIDDADRIDAAAEGTKDAQVQEELFPEVV